MRVAAALVLLSLAGMRAAGASSPCLPAIEQAEMEAGTAPGLLNAIALVESGRTNPATGVRQPWPWTINAEGVGTYYPTKAMAIAAALALRDRGVQSFDVGCMQVNLMHHPAAFASLEQAFDPGANAAYAARYLNTLFSRTGTWSAAAAGYHSMLPDRGAPYLRQVAALWSGGAPSAPMLAIAMRRILAQASGVNELDLADVARHPVQVATFQGGATMRVIYVGPTNSTLGTPATGTRRRS